MATAFLFIMQKYFITKEHGIELPLTRYLTFNEKCRLVQKFVRMILCRIVKVSQYIIIINL